MEENGKNKFPITMSVKCRIWKAEVNVIVYLRVQYVQNNVDNENVKNIICTLWSHKREMSLYVNTKPM